MIKSLYIQIKDLTIVYTKDIMRNYRDKAISIRLSEKELKMLDELKNKRNLTRSWNPESRTDVIMAAINFAMGGINFDKYENEN